MSDRDTSDFRSKSLAGLIETSEAAQNPERFLLDSTIERIRDKDVELAEAIRYCAIPRALDARTIGILREAPDDRETNERLLAGLLSFSFVRIRKDGGYVCHDKMRNALLEDWQADAEKRTSFDQYNQRLVTFYEAQHEEAQQLDQDLEEVAKVMQKANPSRLLYSASVVETRVVAPLLEALYHATLRSAETGHDLFRNYYHYYEERSRLTICESLVNAIRDYTMHLSRENVQESLLRWLDYWEARVMLELRQYSESQAILRDLLERLEVDAQLEDETQLRLWVLDDLGRILQQQSNLRQAREIYETALALARETHEDAFNLPLCYSQLANVYWGMDNLDRAAGIYREAVQAAQGNNPSMVVFTRLDLSGVLQDGGNWAEAFDTALEALQFARTRLPADRSLHQAVLSRFMYLLANRTPRMLDTLFSESKALMPATGDPLQTFDVRIQYIELLQEGGQLGRAEEFLTKLRENTADYVGTAFDAKLRSSEASLRADQGRLDEAIALYSQVIEGAQDDPATQWEHASALSNRGLHYAASARWREARDDFQAALMKWGEIGSETLVALLHVFQASSWRKQGQLAEAQRLLDETQPSLEDTNPIRQATYHQVRGDLYRDRAQWREAHHQYQRALAIRRSFDQAQPAAQSLCELAKVADAQGNWEEAARHTADANRLWLRLSESARYPPSERFEEADKKNADGVKCFFATGADHHERMSRARETFQSATELDPDNYWYRLNLAYACAELEEWGEATRAMKTAFQRGPRWLRTHILHEQLAEYAFKHGETLFRDRDYEGSRQIYSESLNWARNRVRPGRLSAGWLGLGDSLLQLNEADEAKSTYEAGLRAAANIENVIDQATFHGRLACVAASRVDLSGALEHSQRSLHLRAQAGQGAGVSDLVGEWRPLVDSIQQRRTLGEALRVLTDDLDLDQRRALISARLELSMILPAEHAGGIDPAESVPFVTPIVLEADNRLFPQVGETPQVIRMIETDIPLMRERLRTGMGVIVPGVRIRGNDEFEEGEYVLILHEVPLAGGTVPLEGKYCADAAGCRDLGIEEQDSIHPENETEGIWLREPVWERVEASGFPLLDSYQYMLTHLESLVHHHLATFADFQEVQILLQQWKWESWEDRQTLLDAALPDNVARRRLTQVLQELLKEEVSVRDLSAILATFAETNPKYREVTEVAESVRMALRPSLPGNQEGRQLTKLSPEFEATVSRWVWERDGTRFLALPHGEYRQLLGATREYIAGHSVRNPVLVVRESGLRPFVRRLIEGEFPSLPVLAEKELIEGHASIGEQIEYKGQASDADG